jgi:hypothetical protein
MAKIKTPLRRNPSQHHILQTSHSAVLSKDVGHLSPQNQYQPQHRHRYPINTNTNTRIIHLSQSSLNAITTALLAAHQFSDFTNPFFANILRDLADEALSHISQAAGRNLVSTSTSTGISARPKEEGEKQEAGREELTLARARIKDLVAGETQKMFETEDKRKGTDGDGVNLDQNHTQHRRPE